MFYIEHFIHLQITILLEDLQSPLLVIMEKCVKIEKLDVLM